ncbi:MAG: hypothetical protein KAT70_07925 [Thermoplasmata archaeon]|nr:hypothetical protein [Thermoplasmata archaeon]
MAGRMEPKVRDHRPVEDPIGAIFELSDQVSREAGAIKKMVKYSSIFIAFYLLLDMVLFLQAFFGGNPIGAIFFLFLFFLGFVGFRLLRRANRFFRYYELRHRAIRSVRDADPVVHIPQGASAAERAAKRLKTTLPWLSKDLRDGGAEVVPQGILQGRSGTFYTFDRAVVRRPTFLRRWLRAEHGYAIAIKALDTTPRVKDLKAVKKAALDISGRNGIPFYRLMIIWPQSEEGIDDGVYEYATTQLVRFRLGNIRKKNYTAPVELWAESADGTYDLIPYVAP